MPSLYLVHSEHNTRERLMTRLIEALLAIEQEWRQAGGSCSYRRLLRQAHCALGKLYEEVSR